MMTEPGSELIDWDIFLCTRQTLGPHFGRVFGYLVEDGHRSLAEIDAAIKDNSSARLVLPAHCIKGEALQFGAHPLAKVAAHIEYTARDHVELRLPPSDLIEHIAQLRPLFRRSITEIERAISASVSTRRAA